MIADMRALDGAALVFLLCGALFFLVLPLMLKAVIKVFWKKDVSYFKCFWIFFGCVVLINAILHHFTPVATQR